MVRLGIRRSEANKERKQLRFIDALIYCTKMTLKKFDLDIVGGTMTKGRLPYEYINF
ncbi:MAG: hypothetical protein EZS28_047462, partial [Streblomastix strix]